MQRSAEIADRLRELTSLRRSQASLALGLAAGLAACAGGPTQADGGGSQPARQFQLTVLPPFGSSRYPDGPYQSYAYSLDQAGNAVGSAGGWPSSGAALWAADAQPVGFEANGAILQVAYGINAAGQVVGVGACGGWSEGACLWDSGSLSDLGSLGGRSTAHAINNRGDVVGSSEVTAYGFQHAVLWRGGAIKDLGTLGGVQSEALAIDDSGRVVGWARTAGYQPRHGFLWRNGTMADLGTLGGEESIAHAINDSGQVVGWLGQIYSKHAFLWEKGQMSLLQGSEFSEAFGINNKGDVVGTYIPRGTTFHAALWRGGVRYDLSDMVGDATLVLRWATAINDAGEIVGVGLWNQSSLEFGFRLTPIGLW